MRLRLVGPALGKGCVLGLNPNLVWAMFAFGAVHTGALIFFAGKVSVTLDELRRRLDNHETQIDEVRRIAFQLEGRGGK
jgi:hypothetical protein